MGLEAASRGNVRLEGTDEVLVVRAEAPPERLFVLDYGHVARNANPMFFMTGFAHLLSGVDYGYRTYWESKVPLREYKGGYSLPEAISFDPIPPERVSLVGKKSVAALTSD